MPQCSNPDCEDEARSKQYVFDMGKGLNVFRYCEDCEEALVNAALTLAYVSGTRHVLASAFVPRTVK